MANFARINNGVVETIIVVSDCDCGGCARWRNPELPEEGHETCGTIDFPDSEPLGIAFLASLGVDGEFVQTSFSAKFRKRFGQVGFTYDRERDAFLSPCPYPSWTLDSEGEWVSPIPRPDEPVSAWDETAQAWAIMQQPFPSWTPSANRTAWLPPTPRPADEKPYRWHEETQTWVEVDLSQIAKPNDEASA